MMLYDGFTPPPAPPPGKKAGDERPPRVVAGNVLFAVPGGLPSNVVRAAGPAFVPGERPGEFIAAGYAPARQPPPSPPPLPPGQFFLVGCAVPWGRPTRLPVEVYATPGSFAVDYAFECAAPECFPESVVPLTASHSEELGAEAEADGVEVVCVHQPDGLWIVSNGPLPDNSSGRYFLRMLRGGLVTGLSVSHSVRQTDRAWRKTPDGDPLSLITAGVVRHVSLVLKPDRPSYDTWVDLVPARPQTEE
jgi:hypothetical protein